MMRRFPGRRFVLAVAALFCGLPAAALAQRQLHWDAVEVDAYLEADGRLRVTETQHMVFSGDWNGGERRFNLRPRQLLTLDGVARADGDGWRPLTADRSLDDVDDYALVDPETLRWRSRLPSDPPFSRARLSYQLRYTLSNILLTDGEGYVLDHDFLFPDRDGSVNRFQLRLTFDPSWALPSDVRESYTAVDLAPGRGFVLTVPLRHQGPSVPLALDTRRPASIVFAVWTLLLISGGLASWLLVREAQRGRFASLTTQIDEAWLQTHVFAYRPEVVGAAWDEAVGASEVVALLARMEREGKVRSQAHPDRTMTLHLLVDRTTLEGYERALIDGLFFEGRTRTSTEAVKARYTNTGFDPADRISNDLKAAVAGILPQHAATHHGTALVWAMAFSAVAMFVAAAIWGDLADEAVAVAVGLTILAVIGAVLGMVFRSQIQWRWKAAAACLLPPAAAVAAARWFLWSYAGAGYVELSPWAVAGVVALAVTAVAAPVNGMRSRHAARALAFRKRLASARAYFARELKQPRPALKDDWLPWILAFGLGKQVDAWTTRAAAPGASGRSWHTHDSSSQESTWTGFGGGRSGGAGAGASWAAAAGSMAAGVSAAGSSGSSGGGSSGGSSGGGGGGGW